MKYELLFLIVSSKKKQYNNSWNRINISREKLKFCTCNDLKKLSNSARQWHTWSWIWFYQHRLTCSLIKNYSFKTSLNIVSFITKTAVSYSVLSIKNMSTSYKSVIKIRNAVSVQFQNMMIIIVSFKTNQTNIII